MLRSYIKLVMFITSYIPLYAVLVIEHFTQIYVLLFLVITSIISFVMLLLTINTASKIAGFPNIKIKRIRKSGEDAILYLLTYVIPLISLQYNSVTADLAVLLIFSTIGYLYIRTDLIYINPILNLLGYNTYIGNTEENDTFNIKTEEPVIIISKRKVNSVYGNKMVQLAENIYLGY